MKRKSSGFTAIELIVAVAITIIGILGTLSILKISEKQNKDKTPAVSTKETAENCEDYYQKSLDLKEGYLYTIYYGVRYQNCVTRQNLNKTQLNKNQPEKP